MAKVTAEMRIERFDPRTDPDRLMDVYRMYEAAAAVDDPNGPRLPLPESSATLAGGPVRGLMQGGRSFAGWWALGMDGHPQQMWLGVRRDGCYLLELPDGDSSTIAFCLVVVPPRWRRRGVGRHLLEHCAAEAERAGRSMLVGELRVPSAAAAFAAAVGGVLGGTTDQRRVLEIDGSFAARLGRLNAVARSHSPGYSVVSWVGPATDGDVGQVAAVLAAIGDAPRPGSVAAGPVSGSAVRAAEARAAALGLIVYSVAARHGATGELAAVTQVCTDPLLPGWAFQLQTAVPRPHRGRRLGLLVKATMHEWLNRSRPDVRTFMTTNGASNRHMIAVNDQLGYRVSDEFVSWELPISAALAAHRLPCFRQSDSGGARCRRGSQ